VKKALIIIFTLSVVAAATIFAGHRFAKNRDQKPVNVILIGIDTLRADHVTCYGYDKNQTPRLDEAARDGVRFARCVTQAPWTLPSFATVFTSLYPSQHGAQINRELRDLSKDIPTRLRDAVTLTKILKNSGLVTRGIVSNPFTGYGIDRDFDVFQYYWKGAHEITDAGIDFLKKNKYKPFFLYLHYNDPHEYNKLVPEPYTERFTPPEVIARFKDPNFSLINFCLTFLDTYDYKTPVRDTEVGRFLYSLYDAQVSFCDSEVGRFLDEVKARGMWGETLIVILSDHGEEFMEHLSEEKQFGYDPRGIYGSGHGHSLYEELLDVVLIMTGGPASGGKIVKGTARLIDVMPTILDYMNIRAETPMEGASLRPAIESGVVDDRPAISEAIAYGYEKKAVSFKDWKYIFSFYNQMEELYNLKTDPGEKHNLIQKEPERAAFLKKSLVDHLKKSKEERFREQGEEKIDEATKKRLKDLGYLN
jgi:arylsulfatase A-like enzyme